MINNRTDRCGDCASAPGYPHAADCIFLEDEEQQTPTALPWTYDDGGRAAAGFRGAAGDCVARSVAIASGQRYADVYRALARLNAAQGRGRSARNGVDTSRKEFRAYMASLGFEWIPTMGIGRGCRVHLAAGELPTGRLVVAVSRHCTAVVGGVIRDTHDPARGGTRCVYGYWIHRGAK
jgi:hypothetical protein